MSTCLACVLDRKADGAAADAVVVATLAYIVRSKRTVASFRSNLCLLHAGIFAAVLEAVPDLDVLP